MFSADLPQNVWTKSTKCDNSGPNCVEVLVVDNTVLVRNSTNPAAELSFTGDEWSAFLAGARAGEFAI